MKMAWKKTRFALALSLSAAGLTGLSSPVLACGPEPYIGTICAVGFNFCPRGYAPTAGQLLAISQYSALFSLLGTIYGGDGRTTFALPDLRGRTIVGVGTGPGLSPVQAGQKGGAEQVTLSIGQMPVHSHSATTDVTVSATARAKNGAGDTDNPSGHSLAVQSRQNIYSTSAPDADMNAAAISTTASATTTVGNAGGSQPIQIRSPYLGINYCIALEGIYPSRN